MDTHEKTAYYNRRGNGDTSMTWFCFRCPNCGRWRVCEVNDVHKYVFKCHKCRKQRKIKSTKREGLQLQHHGPYNNQRYAARVCAALQIPPEKRGEDLHAEFITHIR